MPATNRDGRAWPAPILLLVGSLTLAGLALRLPLFNDSFQGDELSTYFVVNGFGVDSVINLVEGKQEGTPPLYYLLSSWLGITETPEQLRLIPLLAGIAAIPLTYLLGLRTVGRTAGAIGAALVALSPFLVFYSVEARAYSLAMALALLSTLAMLRALDGGGWGWWAAYALAVAGAMYSHYTAVFVLAAQFGWALLARPEARKPLLIATAAAVALYLPWIPGFLEDRDQPAAKIIEAIRPFTLRSGYDDFLHWAFALHTEPAELIPPSSLSIALIEAGIVSGLVGLALRLRRAEWQPREWLRSESTLVLVLAASTPVGAALWSTVFDSVYLPRNLIASWPGFAVMLGGLAAAGRGWLRIASAALLIVGFGLGGIQRLDADEQRPDYSAAVEFIESEGEPGNPVVELPQPTPGPQTTLEAEIAPPGQAEPLPYPVSPLGMASLERRISSRSEDGPGPLALLPAPSAKELAREVTSAPGGGRVFVIDWGSATIEQLEASPVSPVGEFLRALPPRYEEVASRSFPGFDPYSITVHVLEDRGGAQ